MKLLFWRRRRDRVPSEGEQARQRAELQLARARAETPQYAELGRQTREIREVNHLTELFLNLHTGRGR